MVLAEVVRVPQGFIKHDRERFNFYRRRCACPVSYSEWGRSL